MREQETNRLQLSVIGSGRQPKRYARSELGTIGLGAGGPALRAGTLPPLTLPPFPREPGVAGKTFLRQLSTAYGGGGAGDSAAAVAERFADARGAKVGDRGLAMLCWSTRCLA